jgi:hypothetical protein
MTERASECISALQSRRRQTVNTSISLILRVGLSCSTLGAAVPVLAGTLLVQDHNANGAPDHDAMMRCIVAIRDQVGPGHGLKFSRYAVTERSPRGDELIVVRGSLWDGDARIAIEGRCGSDASNKVVARVIRAQSEAAITTAMK